MTLKLLSETLVGTVVSKLKSHKDAAVQSKAKALVKKWKKLAKEGGVGTSTSTTNVAKPKRAGDLVRRSSTSSTASATAAPSIPANIQQEWDKLGPLRKNIVTKLHDILYASSKVLSDKSDTALRAAAVERAINSISKGDKGAYTAKARSLFFNLKKNQQLRENVLLEHISPKQLVAMPPDQLASADKVKARTEAANQLSESRLLDWEQKNEAKINDMCGIKGDLLKASLFTCGRCKSTKTTSTQKQTRSADEPMTVFVLCMNCGNRWKC